MKAELSVEGGSFRILYDGQELRRSDQVQISQVNILGNRKRTHKGYDIAFTLFFRVIFFQ